MKATVEFAGANDAFRVEGEHAIYENSLLFVAGDYPDHKFSITPEEMAEAIVDFKPVRGNLDHTDWLAGEAVEIRKAWVDPADNTKLRGQVAVPVWLNSVLKEGQKKLSAEWHRATKKLKGIALCTNPGVKDAALVAAFTAAQEHRTYHGQDALQSAHDIAARAGAICDPDPDNKDANFSVAKAVARVREIAHFISHPERRGLQRVHNAAVKHGAKCTSLTRNSYFTQDSPMPSPLAKVYRALFAKNAEGKTPADEPEVAAFLADLEAKEPDLVKEKPDPAGTAPVVNFSDAPEYKSLQAQFTALAEKDLRRDAEAWADHEIRVAKRALPKERDSLIASFTLAADDDRQFGTARFTGGAVKSRVEQLKANQAARPAHSLFAELIPGEDMPKDVVVYSNDQERDAAKVDPKEKALLRSMVPLLAAQDHAELIAKFGKASA